MITGIPITVEVVRPFDYFWHGEIMHASVGQWLNIQKPDVDTDAAMEHGFVKEVSEFDLVTALNVPQTTQIDGDMPQLAIRPNSTDWDASTMIRRAMETHKDNPPDKAITIFLWDEDKKYDTVFFNSGLSIMQAVALLEHVKWDLLKQMDDISKEPKT